MITILFDIVLSMLLIALFAFLKTKASNLATKQDWEELTRIAEAVKSEYALLIEARKNKNELRRATLDRRLQAHQDAYYRLVTLVRNNQKPEFAKLTMESQEWWLRNCLYLEPLAREAFWKATNSLWFRSQLLGTSGPKEPHVLEMIKTSWQEAEQAMQVIIDSVGLPAIKDEYAEIVTDLTDRNGANGP